MAARRTGEMSFVVRRFKVIEDVVIVKLVRHCHIPVLKVPPRRGTLRDSTCLEVGICRQCQVILGPVSIDSKLCTWNAGLDLLSGGTQGQRALYVQ